MANPHSELIGGEEDFAAILEESFKRKGTAKGGELKENEIVRGTVVQVTKDYAVVDIGYKSEGQVPIQEFGLAEGKPNVKVGDAVEVLLESRENDTGMVVLSKEKADKMRIWDEISAACERDELVEGTIVGRVKGGLSVDIGVKAFLPLGAIDGLLHITDMSGGRVGHPSEMLNVGDELRVIVLKFDPASERVSLGLKQIQEDPWAHAAEKYPPGTRIGGKVVSLTDYGAFIEMEPGVEGLVHVSEMSWTKRVKHPSKVMAIGDQVNAVVLDVDAKAKRISLGMKQIEPNPWTLLEEQYPIGSVIRGQVRNVTDFGIFVGVQEGIDGLVHVSDISWTQRIKHPGDLYKKGDEVEAVVLNIDVENERFSLGIKQLHPDPWTELPTKYPIGSRVKGKVTKVADFGAFVEIEPGIEGLVHVSELRDERVENLRDVVKEGDELDVKVIDMDPHERKVALSVKAALHEGDDYREYMRNQGTGRASLGEVFGEKLGGRKGRDR